MQEVPSRPDDLIGHVLGGAYEIEAPLDEGGMGTVYRARHLRLGRPLAVKIMAPHLTLQPGALERFSREAEIISQLSHPHVVQVLDFNTTEDGRPYLVMELLEGRPLDALLAQHGRLQLTAALEIACQAARALAAAHQAGIVHRDLKPANIFLMDAGEQLFAKLLDFGISKRTHGEPANSRKLTGEFDILGTPDYMAPEQAVGKTSTVDHRGDQYALATILYEMLVGQVPFAAEEILELLQQVIRDAPPPPSKYRADIPEPVEAAILRALQKDPDDRFPSILDFAEILELARDEVRLNSPEFGRASMQRYSRSTAQLAPTSSPPLHDEGLSLPPDPPAVGEASIARSSARVAAPRRANATSIVSPLAQAAATPTPGSHTYPTPPPRTSWHARSPASATKELIDRARQELGLDNLSVAVSCAESALEMSRSANSAEVNGLIERNATLLQRIFERSLARSGQRIVLSEHPFSSVELSPEEAFLLSRLETGMTVEEAIDLSPLSRERTLGRLVSLVASGQIQLKL